MVKAIAIEVLQIYPSHISEIIASIVASGEFRQSGLAIGEEEVILRNLNSLEMALFTASLNILDKHNSISAIQPLSLMEKALLTDYTEQYQHCCDLLIETILLDPVTENFDSTQIGIREGHILVLLPERNPDFEFTMYRPDCMQCPNYETCNHPDKEYL